MDWKDDLAEYFSEKSSFRLEIPDNKLAEYCKEWADYTGSFSGSHVKFSREVFSPGLGRKSIGRYRIEVAANQLQPFIIYLNYTIPEGTRKISLAIRYTSRMDAYFLFSGSRDDEDRYEWAEVVESDQQVIYEKEFILQTINNCFKEYDSKKYITASGNE